MGISWNEQDDQEFQQHRVSTRWQRAMQFLDDALEADTPKPEAESGISKS